jgi:M6 family metalloprotease-like protein
MIKRITLFVALSLLSLISFHALAVPANPNPVETVQPDGTPITYFIKGDEKVNWLQSTDGYTLLRNENQFIVYAEKNAEGNLVPSKHIYGAEQLRSSGVNQFLSKTPKDLRYSAEQVEMLTQIWRMTESEIQTTPVKGDKKALCILAGFLDKSISKSVAEFEALMNQVGYSSNGATGSVKDFYRENSYGQMDLTVTVVGPVTVPNTAAYYGRGEGLYYQEFAKEVLLAADEEVDFSEFANEEGVVETFHIIFAGYGDENIGDHKQIWSHKSNLRSPITLDEVRLYVYSCSPELRGRSGSSITTIGVVCHELCHVFGADDYYDTDYAGNGGDYPSTGNWDLMSGGSWNGNNQDGSCPAHINMFQKMLYAWVEPVALTDSLTVTNMPNSAENPVAYIVKPSTDNEMYVLENRQKVAFDSKVPGTGLLIYHIHNSAANGRINNTKHPQQAYVVCASSTTAIPNNSVNSYGLVNSSRAPFTNMTGRDEFSDTSTPRMFRWDGLSGIPVTDKGLTEIAQANDLISFRFRGGDAEETEVAYNPVSNLQSKIAYNEIILDWQYPAGGNYPTGYELYREDELLATLPVNERKYIDEDRETGSYNYCVKAVYPDTISEAECVVVDFERAYCFPAVDLSAQVAGDTIKLSWEIPADPDGKTYTYTLYLEDKIIAQNLEETSFDYRPKDGGEYRFSVIAYTDDCRAEQAEITVSFHPQLNFELQGVPENVYTKQSYPVSLELTDETDEEINYTWSFSNDLATIVPGEKSNEIQLVTGEEKGTGILKAEVSYFHYSPVFEKELDIQFPVGINEIHSIQRLVYPNPVHTVLTVSTNEVVRLYITDSMGRAIYADPRFKTQSIDVSAWAKGVYFVRIQTQEGTKMEKVIKN